MVLAKKKLTRISITVPEDCLAALDSKIVEQQYESRSQAIVDMIRHHLTLVDVKNNEVMVGTLTLLYDRTISNIRKHIDELQHQYLAQVVSSFYIQLDQDKILEVFLMQGTSQDLQHISQQFIALKGIIRGHLELMDAIMPPLQQNQHHDVESNVIKNSEA